MNQVLLVKQIKFLRDITFIGEEIEFNNEYFKTNIPDESNIVRGCVTAKYPNIFYLEDGRCFTWVDYILGNPIIKDMVQRLCPVKYRSKKNLRNDYAVRTMCKNNGNRKFAKKSSPYMKHYNH